MNSYWVCVCLHVVEKQWEKVEEKGGQKEKKLRQKYRVRDKEKHWNQGDMETEALTREQQMEKNVFFGNLQSFYHQTHPLSRPRPLLWPCRQGVLLWVGINGPVRALQTEQRPLSWYRQQIGFSHLISCQQLCLIRFLTSLGQQFLFLLMVV